MPRRKAQVNRSKTGFLHPDFSDPKQAHGLLCAMKLRLQAGRATR